MDEFTSFFVYQDLAQRTANRELNATERLACAALGVSDEAGEVSGAVKKYLYHGHDWEVTQEKIVEELGDVLWYVAEMCAAIKVPMHLVAKQNIDKLMKRYPQGFSEEASRNRATA